MLKKTADLVVGGTPYPNEMVRFHKALPNVKSAYVTLQDFTQELQKKLHRYICHICDIMQL